MSAFPVAYFGGKSSVADEVWRRLGNVDSYIEPFFGSGAVLLGRPDAHKWESRKETVNDKDGMVSNFWRALQAAPEEVAYHADWPVNENDLHARHAWLVGQKESLQSRLEGDPDYYDAKIAGWWCWGMSCWIGGGFCSGKGPWQVQDGRLERVGDGQTGVKRERPHLTSAQGVNRLSTRDNLIAWMEDLAARLRRVRVCCGDWTRICTPVLINLDSGTVGVFLDPPHAAEQGRDMGVYSHDSPNVARAVRGWAVEQGGTQQIRIALCGYEGIEMPPDWLVYAWKAHGGYGVQGEGRGRENARRERIWFSPGCNLNPQGQLWEEA